MKTETLLGDLADDDEIALKRFVDHGYLKQLTQEILDDESRLAAIAERSCEHVNGFSLIQLRPLEAPYERLRLHFYESECLVGDPHTHRWSFSSVILDGQLDHEIFEESGQGEDFLRTECLPKRHGFHLQDETPVQLANTWKAVHRPGDSYKLAGHEIHRFGPGAKIQSMSLVMQRQPFTAASRVYIKPGGQMGTGEMGAILPERLQSILLRLKKLL